MLSRHVGLVEEPKFFSKELRIREQKEDKFCEEQAGNCQAVNSEHFLDLDGVLYRRAKGKQPKLVVPQSLIRDVIAENHNPVFVGHPDLQLISLKYWWTKMQQRIEEYIQRCDKCQTRKRKHEFRAHLGEVESPSGTFQITAMDITGPYILTLRKNKYLLTTVCHFTVYI